MSSQSMSASELRDRLNNLLVWRRGEQRAPHKPLLLLLAIAKAARGEPRLMPFHNVNDELGPLLQEFGPPRKQFHPEYPFWRLQNDSLWEVPDSAQFQRRASNTDPRKSELLRYDAVGGFPTGIYRLIRSRPRLRREIAAALLTAHFPETYHDDILQAVGLEISDRPPSPHRDSAFRQAVIEAYSYKCAICGYDAHLRGSPVGLDAAHIRWVAYGGSDAVDNGLALCAIHHRAFDRGGIGIDPSLRVIVSAGVHGGRAVHDWFDAFNMQPLNRPHATGLVPSRTDLLWHLRQVFRKPAKGSGPAPDTR